MELYNRTSLELSELLTRRYSTSFSMSSRLFSGTIKPHIYAIYGLVRIADEIVDTYMGDDAATLLDELERHTHDALTSGYSPNPIVHAFVITGRRYGIGMDLLAPFFASMRMDLTPKTYTDDLYDDYIYGSAEVIGLMCLRVFCDGNTARYDELSSGARALGAAYQKVNFLRDMHDDYARLGRVYFPGVDFQAFDEVQKRTIEHDIEKDFVAARVAIGDLPVGARTALKMSYDYYYSLFQKLTRADPATIKAGRLRLPTSYKLLLFARRVVLR